MDKEQIDYAVIKNTIANLAVICAADENKIIDLLTGYLWCEEAAGGIKESDGKFKFLGN